MPLAFSGGDWIPWETWCLKIATFHVSLRVPNFDTHPCVSYCDMSICISSYQYTWCITGIPADHSPQTAPRGRFFIAFVSKWPFQRAPCQSIKTCTTGPWKRCRWFRSPGGFSNRDRSLAGDPPRSSVSFNALKCYLGWWSWHTRSESVTWGWFFEYSEGKKTRFLVFENTPNRLNTGVQQAALFNPHQSTIWRTWMY